jgi:signal transduction histidine kinase
MDDPYRGPVTATTTTATVLGMDDVPTITLGGLRLSTTLVMSLAATVAALIAVLGELNSITWITVVFALIGLAPWALEATGIRLGLVLFLTLTMIPAAAIVLLDGNPGGLFPVILAVVWITHRRTSRGIVAAALVAAFGMTIGLVVAEPSKFEGIIYFLGGIGIAWLTGMLLHRQEALVAELRNATERERAHAATEERTRIAREVHDVIAHSLTVTILQVAGARRALANDPERVATALEQAENIGRESLESIRQVVGLLRVAEHTPAHFGKTDEAPLPQVSDIELLVSQYREAGLHVEASMDLEGITASAMTSLAAFRITQEAITNSLQHAPGEPVSLRIYVDRAHSALLMTIENPLQTSTARRKNRRTNGLGITGMTERIRTVGGSITIGPTNRNTWLVDAQLPVQLVEETS